MLVWLTQKSSGTESGEQDTSSRSGNDAHADDADIEPIYDEEPMAEVQLIADHNVFATRQQHTEQPEFNNKGETVAQFQKDFSKLEAHCINLELQLQNNDLKSGQQSQVLNKKSNEAKIKHEIDVIETINIKLEHKLATLLKENETLKRHYKELSDSIKTTRAKTIEHTTSLIAKNDEFKAQLQEQGFAIAALKNELRKLKGNSMNTKFAKSSILGKLVLQPHRNQSIIRQPIASQVDVNNDLSKPVTTHCLPKGKEPACVKPHHINAPGSSRYSLNDMVHNHYLEEAKKQTQKISRNSKTSVMPSARSQSTSNDCNPKPRSNTQTSRNWHASKSSTSINVQEERTLDLHAGTLFNLNKERIKVWIKENVIYGRPRLQNTPERQRKVYVSVQLSLELQEKSSNIWLVLTEPEDSYKDGDGDTSFQLKIKLRGRLLESFKIDAKYEHVGQDTRSQGGKDDQDKQGKDLKISEQKTK
ncbi:hypothetical protein Tco_0859411 [Tanacetum coccineum]|uniref:Uncharacterized protein n=1 Tax=Tanacetum coccineum TaxID=301880 RepID=A0ABQ5BHM2_9ASTR